MAHQFEWFWFFDTGTSDKLLQFDRSHWWSVLAELFEHRIHCTLPAESADKFFVYWLRPNWYWPVWYAIYANWQENGQTVAGPWYPRCLLLENKNEIFKVICRNLGNIYSATTTDIFFISKCIQMLKAMYKKRFWLSVRQQLLTMRNCIFPHNFMRWT